MKIDWSSLDTAACYVMKGDGFVINDYGHPDYLRYIENNRLLTLSYQYIDETPQRGRRFFIFRNYGMQVQIPKEPVWDDGTPRTENEVRKVLERICKTFAQYKKRPCHVVVDEKLYGQIEANQRARQMRKVESTQVDNR
jgi:hypothetical protein